MVCLCCDNRPDPLPVFVRFNAKNEPQRLGPLIHVILYLALASTQEISEAVSLTKVDNSRYYRLLSPPNRYQRLISIVGLAIGLWITVAVRRARLYWREFVKLLIVETIVLLAGRLLPIGLVCLAAPLRGCISPTKPGISQSRQSVRGSTGSSGLGIRH